MNQTEAMQARRSAPTAPGLKHLLGAAAGALALLAALPAAAAVIDFESQGATTYGGGETFGEAGYTLRVLDSLIGAGDGGGAAGILINGRDAASCDVAACPAGNKSNYYGGINDGGLNISRDDHLGFHLSGLDFAFIAPIGGLVDYSYGQLVLTGNLVGGGSVRSTFSFPGQNGKGEFVFSGAGLNNGFRNATLSGLTISACLFGSGGGTCYNPAGNQAQFAIDNLNLSAVPEPETYLMLLSGLAGLGLLARRRSTAAATATATATNPTA
ncbi:NF038120 family PEP-CTERM protein [Rugamonas sp. CCM 8940]|uniref:NF038120 family PEP-CTERM protein n=1 Tax=Rugamonas sp. CCM 8940 TaxID=2765359 RepID=UPI0018F32965|nr:NF038120 family PEP-CTERM protein [Rugamonas sp. CCM 8940]MBJ7312758.1 NF038120 family PEP-CTERM protein [Rugamonas sp. CCM 8940]